MTRKTRSDKGKKRYSYGGLRRLRKLYEDARQTRRESVMTRSIGHRRKPGRPQMERYYDRRRAQVPENNRCPVCDKLVTKSRGWVLKEGMFSDVLHQVSCLSCWRTRRENKDDT